MMALYGFLGVACFLLIVLCSRWAFGRKVAQSLLKRKTSGNTGASAQSGHKIYATVPMRHGNAGVWGWWYIGGTKAKHNAIKRKQLVKIYK